MARKSKKWTGILNKPIIIDPFNPEKSFKEQYWHRINALFKRYNIDLNNSDKWFLLATYLATEVVPAFRIDCMSNTAKYNNNEAIVFYANIRRYILENNVTIRKAIDKYSHSIDEKIDIETLERDYHRIKSENYLIKGYREMALKILGVLPSEDSEFLQKENEIEKIIDGYVMSYAESIKNNSSDVEAYKKELDRLAFEITPFK